MLIDVTMTALLCQSIQSTETRPDSQGKMLLTLLITSTTNIASFDIPQIAQCWGDVLSRSPCITADHQHKGSVIAAARAADEGRSFGYRPTSEDALVKRARIFTAIP